MEDNLTFFTKQNTLLTIQSSNCLPWHLPKWTEILCPHKNLHMDAYNRFIHNHPNLKTTKMSFSRWIYNKKRYSHIIEYYSLLKRNELASYEKTWKNLKYILLSEKSQFEKGYMHTVWSQIYDILEKAKLWRQWKDQWLPGSAGREEWIVGTRRILRAVKLFCLILTVMVDMRHYTFVKTHTGIPRANPKVSYGLWVIIVCQWVFISWTNVPLWWRHW